MRGGGRWEMRERMRMKNSSILPRFLVQVTGVGGGAMKSRMLVRHLNGRGK